MVKETAFYDLLGVKPDASKDQIRKAYYRKAKACHPDKHPGDKDKESEFKAVSEAYQILSDDESRKAYDQFGKESLNGHGGFADPRDMFAAVFGGPEFEPYIGTLRMCAPVDERLQNEVEEARLVFATRQEELQQLQESGLIPPAEVENARRELLALSRDLQEKRGRLDEANAEVQRQRVRGCANHLRGRAQQYAAAGEGRRESFREIVKQDFETLRKSNMGEPILHAIGYVYVCETQKMLGKYGVGVHQVAGYFEEAREGYHKFAEVAGAIGSGIQLLRANYKLSRDAQAQAEGPQAQAKLSDEDREWYEKSIQKRMFHIVWTLTKKDIEDTLREVVDSVLLDEADHGNATAVEAVRDIECRTVLSPAALLYAEAIMLMGDIFMEAMSFDQFLSKDDPPTFMERTARDMDDRLKAQAGIDVAYHRKVAAAAAQEAAINAGTAINKLFGWTKK